MYTNRAYETSSELDDVSAGSANSAGHRGTSIEKQFDQNVPPSTRAVSNGHKPNHKSSSKYIHTVASDDRKQSNDHRGGGGHYHKPSGQSKRSSNLKQNGNHREI